MLVIPTYFYTFRASFLFNSLHSPRPSSKCSFLFMLYVSLSAVSCHVFSCYHFFPHLRSVHYPFILFQQPLSHHVSHYCIFNTIPCNHFGKSAKGLGLKINTDVALYGEDDECLKAKGSAKFFGEGVPNIDKFLRHLRVFYSDLTETILNFTISPEDEHNEKCAETVIMNTVKDTAGYNFVTKWVPSSITATSEVLLRCWSTMPSLPSWKAWKVTVPDQFVWSSLIWMISCFTRRRQNSC